MAVLTPRCGALLVAGALLAAACDRGPADTLLVLHTANAYGYFDTCGCRADSTGGLAKRAWVIDSLRREDDAPILLVDAGDFTGGDNAYGAALGRVLVNAMELMEYDAFTLGEWDINQGVPYVREVVSGNAMAWVHTNYDIVGLEDLGHRTLVVEKGGRRIGLLGLFNPTILLNPAMRDSVVVHDIVESTTQGVAALRAENVDAIVVLSHLSYKGDLALTELVEGIDLIVSGHGGKSLTSVEQAGTDTWIAASGDLGRFLGRVELAFGDPAPDGTAVADATGGLIVMVPSMPNDPRLEPLFAEYEAARGALRQRELDARRPATAPPAIPDPESPL
ncbi:MAG: hypothetical protein ABR559_03965 [Gemmatimonadota bacterium]